MALSDIYQGAKFFSWFLPSFSNIGFALRRRAWTDPAPDFTGQTWIVTGASTGIGREIAKGAARGGATVYAVARTQETLDTLAAETVPLRGLVVPIAKDLSLMADVKTLIQHLAAELQSVEVLVNNVGLMLDEQYVTKEAQEVTFATNLLGHFNLTQTARELGLVSNDTTIINMSSGGMYNVPLSLHRLQGGKEYNGTLTYAYQKRGQVSLSAWWREQGLKSYVMHPGWVATPGVKTAMPRFYKALKYCLRDVAAGADTALWLAQTAPAQEQHEGIWFDRALSPAHVLSGTRNGASAAELVDYLRTQYRGASQPLS